MIKPNYLVLSTDAAQQFLQKTFDKLSSQANFYNGERGYLCKANSLRLGQNHNIVRKLVGLYLVASIVLKSFCDVKFVVFCRKLVTGSSCRADHKLNDFRKVVDQKP